MLKETERYNFATNVKKIREKAFARRCNRKTRKKKKEGKTRQDLDGRIHRLPGSIGQGGRVLFGVRTRARNLLRNP